jgi:ubiquitin C-terminal hydrolase
LYGFLISSYIDCGAHKSTRAEEYLDLSLPVRNQYTKELYNSIEECLKSYLMPEDLDDVECSGCEKKVNVKKGMSLESMPVIFTIQLNRF